jgi:hypothetical protein
MTWKNRISRTGLGNRDKFRGLKDIYEGYKPSHNAGVYRPIQINPLTGFVFQRNHTTDDMGLSRNDGDIVICPSPWRSKKGTAGPRSRSAPPEYNWQPSPEYYGFTWREIAPKGNDVCSILKHHSEAAAEDPEHLPTDFIKSLIFKDEDQCPEVS